VPRSEEVPRWSGSSTWGQRYPCHASWKQRGGVSVHLTIREEERLQIWTAAEMARRRLARGVRLNEPEASFH
jgi:hypothetical protein